MTAQSCRPRICSPPPQPSRLLTSLSIIKQMSVGCFEGLRVLLQDCPLVCSSLCPSTDVRREASCSVNSTYKENFAIVPGFSFHCSSFFVSLPQENDLNNMLNSLYDLPVPKPFTPVNLSVVGIHTPHTLPCQRRWTSGGCGICDMGEGDAKTQPKLSKSRAKRTKDQLEKKGTKQRNNENLNTKDSDEEETKMAPKQAGRK